MRIEETIYCDGCGVEILWAPVKEKHREYCCTDCRDGYECSCGARMDEDDYPRGSGMGESASISDGMIQ
jgi:hypothetical protein